eukprot:TRINITY_DN2659_c0_g2_i1.p1 TRINITY_DN2659_c0_g2~~TRINITY_DN2659_c0_g2_i1.p1  ORF type:complete len:390 (-),score=68.25 TRINITY_DN2659_c0_g2_i1:227-1396(-)
MAKEKYKSLSQYLIYVLIPYSCKKDHSHSFNTTIPSPTPTKGLLDHPECEVESPDYAFPIFQQEVASWMNDLGCEWIWQPVSLKSMNRVIDHIAQVDKERKCLALNFCDGTETDGFPGVSVIKLLQSRGLGFSGSLPFYFEITANKPEMKKLFIKNNVPTAPFVEIKEDDIENCIRTAKENVGFPLIVKPSRCYAATGIQKSSICYNEEEAKAQIQKLFSRKDIGEGVFVEKFIVGREFTVLVVGDREPYSFPVVERAFNKSIPIVHRILTENLNEIIDAKHLFDTKPADDYLQPIIQDIAKRAFISLNGTGYGRADIRMSTNEDNTPICNENGSPKIYVLEMNAQCAFGSCYYGTPSSVDAMTQYKDSKMSDLIAEVLLVAIQRRKEN